jgi:hypothetical protein
MEHSSEAGTSPTKREVVVTGNVKTVDQIFDENESPLSHRRQGHDSLSRKEDAESLAHYFVSLSSGKKD